jgi:hypothetical protein
MEMGTIKQTDVDPISVGASLEIDRHLQARCEFSTLTDTDLEAVGALLQADVNALQIDQKGTFFKLEKMESLGHFDLFKKWTWR